MLKYVPRNLLCGFRQRQRDPPSRPLPLRAKLGTFCACAPTPPSSRSLYHIASPALWSVWALPDQKPSTSTFWRRPRPFLSLIPPSHHHHHHQTSTTTHSLFDNDVSQGSLEATHPPVAGSLFLDPGVNIRSIPLPPRISKPLFPHHRFQDLRTSLFLLPSDQIALILLSIPITRRLNLPLTCRVLPLATQAVAVRWSHEWVGASNVSLLPYVQHMNFV